MSASTTAPAMRAAPPALRLALMFCFMVTIWSLSFVVIKHVAREVPPVLLTAMRGVGSALVMIPVGLWEARRHPHSRWSWSDFPKLLVVATLGITLNHLFFIMGLSRTSVAHSSIVMSLMPAVVLVLAILAGQERSTPVRFAGLAIAMAGVAVLQLRRQGQTEATPLGDLLVFAGSLAFAGYTVVGKSLTSRYGAVYVTTLSFVIGAVSLVPIAWISGEWIPLSRISAGAWLSLAYLVVIHTAICYLIYYYLLTHMAASRVSLFGYIQPVLASFFAWVLLGEPVTAAIAAGGVLVVAGVWLAERGPA